MDLPAPRCLVFGASGQTGREIIKELAKAESLNNLASLISSNVSSVSLVVRKGHLDLTSEFGLDSSNKFEVVSAPDLMTLSEEHFAGEKFDIAFCAIGTTLNKVGKNEFESVERDLVIHLANVAKQLGCKQFHLVSGFMSSPSSMFFIPRVKGEGEQGVAEEGPTTTVVYRPGLLRCDRTESRPLEAAARWVSDYVDKADWWSLSTSKLARVMVEVAMDLWTNPGQDGSGSARGQPTVMEHWDIVQRDLYSSQRKQAIDH